MQMISSHKCAPTHGQVALKSVQVRKSGDSDLEHMYEQASQLIVLERTQSVLNHTTPSQ